MATPSYCDATEFLPISLIRRRPSKTLISCRPSSKLFLPSKGRGGGYLQFNNNNNNARFRIHINSPNFFTRTLVARADDANLIGDDDDPIQVIKGHGSSKADEDLEKQKKSSQLSKRVVFGLGIGITAGGVVLTGGWVFSVALAAVVFAGSREYFELVRSRGIASGMTPPPRYVSRACSVICALMPLFTLYKGQIDVSVASAAFVVAMALLLQRGNPRFSQLSSTIFGLFYCGYLPSFWVKLRCCMLAPALNTQEWELHGLYF